MKVSLIVPVFNEEESIPIFYKTVREQQISWGGMGESIDVEICFINDGSRDKTEQIINQLAKEDPLVRAISFTRNFGKEPALCCGLDYCTGDAVIPMDVDLQDPIEVIPEMLRKYKEGSDVVLAKRSDRSSDSWMKRKTAEWFYIIHNAISNPKIEENVGDFRLMSRTVVENIKQLKEKNVFMKGLLSWVGGNRVEIVEYVRQERSAGQSKFNAWKLWNLAIEGITSFSTAPLKICGYFGLLISTLSFCYALWLIVSKLIWGNPVAGYPSIMTAVLFLGGVQLIGIGVLGEYIGRVYIETKNRPRYIVKSKGG